jgi:glucose-1-phosphate thymidylyltransferase
MINNNEKIGLIPAAGKGFRMGLPFPKELFPILYNQSYLPVAQFAVDRILQAKVNHIVFVINEAKTQLINYFKDGKSLECQFSYVFQNFSDTMDQISTSPGLAHALDSAYHLIQNKTVFFSMADTIIYPRDMLKKAYSERKIDTDIILCLFKTNQPENYGMVEIDECGEKITKIIDKPQLTALEWMWGSIIWKPIFSEFLHDQVQNFENFDFASILNQAIDQGLRFSPYEIYNGQFIDIGNSDFYNLISQTNIM